MIKTLLLLLMYFPSAQAVEPIRVRIFSVPAAGIELTGDSFQIQSTSTVSPAGLVTVMRAKISFLDIFGAQWKIERNENQKIVVRPFLKINGKNLRVNLNRTPEKIVLWPNENGDVDVIAVMNIEDYLNGVLPQEMPSSWPVEALKAQAIAARSYAVAQMKARESRPYHVDSSVDDQVFRFQDARVEKYRAKILQIVNETKGVVLKNQDGSILRSYFHADCGGRTEQADAVWENGEKNPTVKDDHCKIGGKDQWTMSTTVQDIQTKLKLKKVTEVKPYFRSSSGRVQSVVIKDESNEVILSGQELRSKLGFKKLKSTLFDIHINKNLVQFIGRGYGHGVGLCQVGSRALADQGVDYVSILKHYFPVATLGSLQ